MSACTICKYPIGQAFIFLKGGLCTNCGNRIPTPEGEHVYDVVDKGTKFHAINTSGLVCNLCGHRGTIGFIPCGGLEKLVAKEPMEVAA